jgi:hypothetical protein
MTGRPQVRPDVRTVVPFLVGLACFAAIAVLDQVRHFVLWRNYALSGVVLGGITTWVVYRLDVRVPRYIQWVIVTALLLHYGGGSLGNPDPYEMGLLGYHGINGAYHVHSWWDNLTHFMGIGAGTMAITYLLDAYQTKRGLAWTKTSIWMLAVATGLAAGVGVELYEYLGKTAFQTIDQGGYGNTIADLQFNFLGSALASALAVTVDRRRLASQIEHHWGQPERTMTGQPLAERVSAPMMGFIAFVAVPAGMTLWLAARDWHLLPGATLQATYDGALQLLLGSAIAGAVCGPIAGLAWARRTRRPDVEAA